MTAADHLVIAPIVLPLVAGALMLLVDERRVGLKSALGVAASVATAALSVALLLRVDAAGTEVYRVGDWPAPFGIVLVADRLSAALVVLASALSVASALFSSARWDREGPRYHTLAQFLVVGVNGAFLTGDLFNLFVFFEVMLAASYGLALHGSGELRVRAGLKYITVNLTASLLFLVGASLIYGAIGTLNLADISARAVTATADQRSLLDAGAAVLAIAFLAKAAMWPLCFWLVPAYSAASPPAAALFAVLTKVGFYALLRIGLLLHDGPAGASAHAGWEWLRLGGFATLAFGTLGVLASQDLGRLASYSIVVSSGTLLATMGGAAAALTGAALYYLVASVLGAAALFLLREVMERGRGPGEQVLAVTAELFEADEIPRDDPLEEVGIAIPAPMAIMGVCFTCAALMVAGLPPLAGFVGKFAILHAMLAPAPVPATSWTMLALLLVSGLASMIALARVGVRRFWASPDRPVPRVGLVEMAPIVLLLSLCAALTIAAAPVLRYLNDAARALHAPSGYVERVLVP
jgi:multicomponent K+:H+ antiporter subunit D